MKFSIEKEDQKSHARAGVIHTDHGKINTPVFMPVGTAGTVKAVHQRELEQDIQAQIILGNTYHLFLRPGLETIEAAGGLHRFNGWNKPMLTDSGGYQVFSLAAKRKINSNGVRFQSHVDGTRYTFTPEYVIEVQRKIGADIIMAFDECTPYPCTYDYARKSMELTHDWLARCIDTFAATEPHYGHAQELFPIVQGSTYPDLRQKSAEKIARYECKGNAIGGLSVGEPDEKMYEMTDLVCRLLPVERPRYLMGVGTPANMLESIKLGVDMFDCVMPTRNARNGMLFTEKGIMNIKNEKWKNDFSSIDGDLPCFINDYYSKAYLRHLIISKEILGAQIASIHNLRFYLWLMEQARAHILKGDFSSWVGPMIKKVSARV